MDERTQEMEKAGLAIPKVLEKHKLLSAYKFYQVKWNWPDIVGEQIAKYSYVRDYQNQVVTIGVLNSVWMSQLFMHKQSLIQRVNEYAGEVLVRDMRFIRSGRKPPKIVYETLDGEASVYPIDNVAYVRLDAERVQKIRQETANLPEGLQERVAQLRFAQEKRNVAGREAGIRTCPDCGRWLQPGETVCTICRLKRREKRKQELYRLMMQMPWITLEELEQNGCIPAHSKMYTELYNEIRRECIYRCIEKIHHGWDTAEDDMLLALMVTRKNPTEMTDAYIQNLTNKYRRNNDVSAHRR